MTPSNLFKRLQTEISEIHVKFSYCFTSDWLISFTVRVHFPINFYCYRLVEPLIPPVLPGITRLRLNEAGKLAESVYSSELLRWKIYMQQVLANIH